MRILVLGNSIPNHQSILMDDCIKGQVVGKNIVPSKVGTNLVSSLQLSHPLLPPQSWYLLAYCGFEMVNLPELFMKHVGSIRW